VASSLVEYVSPVIIASKCLYTGSFNVIVKKSEEFILRLLRCQVAKNPFFGVFLEWAARLPVTLSRDLLLDYNILRSLWVTVAHATKSVITRKTTRRFDVAKNQRIYMCTSPSLYEC
jgi:hypothetical protein